MKRKIIDEKIERLRHDQEFLDRINEVIECDLQNFYRNNPTEVRNTVFQTIGMELHVGVVGKVSYDVIVRLQELTDELLYQNERFILEML